MDDPLWPIHVENQTPGSLDYREVRQNGHLGRRSGRTGRTFETEDTLVQRRTGRDQRTRSMTNLGTSRLSHGLHRTLPAVQTTWDTNL